MGLERDGWGRLKPRFTAIEWRNFEGIGWAARVAAPVKFHRGAAPWFNMLVKIDGESYPCTGCESDGADPWVNEGELIWVFVDGEPPSHA